MCEQCKSKPYGLCDCGCGKPRGKRGCIAHSKTTKLLCSRKPKADRGMHVCWSHGGNTPKGPAAPSWKHGKVSKHLPEGMRKDYEDSITDPRRFAFDQNVALVDSLIGLELRGLKDGVAIESVERAKLSMLEAAEAAKQKDTVRFAAAFDEALKQISAALDAQSVQDSRVQRLRKLVAERRQNVRAEVLRQRDERLVLTAEQAMTIAARQLEIQTAVLIDQSWAKKLGVTPDKWFKAAKLIAGKLADEYETEANRWSSPIDITPAG